MTKLLFLTLMFVLPLTGCSKPKEDNLAQKEQELISNFQNSIAEKQSALKLSGDTPPPQSDPLSITIPNLEELQKTNSAYTKNTVNDTTQLYEISVEYPVFAGKDKLNAMIKAIVDSRLEEFKAGVELFQEDITDDRKHFFQLWTTETTWGENLSVLFNHETYYIGRARGIHGTCASIVYNTETDTQLALTDLCGMTAEEVARFCHNNLPEEAVYKDQLLTYTEEAIAALPFVLNETDVSVFFPPDTVAPNAAGEFFLRIPLKNQP